MIQFIDLGKKKMHDLNIKLYKDPRQYQEELEELSDDSSSKRPKKFLEATKSLSELIPVKEEGK